MASSYGFEEATGLIQMVLAPEGPGFKPNTVTLMLDKIPKARKVDVVLLDASTERILATVAGVPVTIAEF